MRAEFEMGASGFIRDRAWGEVGATNSVCSLSPFFTGRGSPTERAALLLSYKLIE